MSSETPRDLLVVGGGLAGASIALQVQAALPEVRVTLVERRLGPAPEATHKVGESFVELASWHLRKNLGLEEHLQREHLPKLGLRFFMRRPSDTPIDQRLEYGVFPPPDRPWRAVTLPTFNVDRGRLENHLLERVEAAGVEVLRGSHVEAIELGAPHRISLRDPEGTKRWLRAGFVVDASGRRAILKRALNLAEPIAHQADASWVRVDRRIDLEEWSAAPEWRGRIRTGLRWTSTNHLVGEGYWIWLIPLGSGGTSVGLVTDPRRHRAPGRLEELRRFLACHEPELAAAVDERAVLDHRVVRGGAFGCAKLLSTDGWAIVGDAGFFLDPLYSPGADFIAIQSCLVTELIRARLTGEPEARLAVHGEQVLQRLFDQHLAIYRGYWRTTADPAAMGMKVAWDTAAYFAFNLFLFQRGLLTRPDAMATLQPEVRRSVVLQRRAQRCVHRWTRPGREARGRMAQFRPDFFYDLYRRSEPDGSDPRGALRQNLSTLERFAGSLERVTQGGEAEADFAPLFAELELPR